MPKFLKAQCRVICVRTLARSCSGQVIVAVTAAESNFWTVRPRNLYFEKKMLKNTEELTGTTFAGKVFTKAAVERKRAERGKWAERAGWWSILPQAASDLRETLLSTFSSIEWSAHSFESFDVGTFSAPARSG